MPTRESGRPWLSREDVKAVAALLLLVGAFLFGASRRLDLPGVWADEAADPTYGMEIALGLPPTTPQWGFHAFGRSWPLLTPDSYDLSGFAIYWSALAFKVGGVGIRSLRWAFLLVGAGVLALLFALAQEWFSTRVALWACVLLAVDPVFICWNRVGAWAIEWSVVFFGLGAALCGLLWHRTRRARFLCAAAFLAGFGLNASVKALAFILALPLLYALTQPLRLWPRGRPLLAAAACLLLGAFNSVSYNVARGFPTAVTLLRSLAAPTRALVDNTALLTNLWTRLGQLVQDLNGVEPQGLAGRESANWLAVAAFLIGFAALAGASLFARPRADKAARGVLGLFGLLLLCTCFTPNSLNSEHLIVLWPFVALIVALGAERLWRRKGRWSRPLALAALAAVVLSQLRSDALYLRALSEIGGEGVWSDGVYGLTQYLDERGIRRPLALSWGTTENVYLLSSGRVRPISFHRGRRGMDAELAARYDDSIKNGDDRYLALAAPYGPRWQAQYVSALEEAAGKAGKSLALEATFGDRLGRPVFLLYHLERARGTRARRG
jgi:hypothetical protein